MPRLPPGSTIGILGGGQLGRMTALAAAALGYRCHVLCPDRGSPAAEVAGAASVADYDDRAALERFAAAVDVVTCEFENVPASAVAHLAARVPARPGKQALEIAQDRVREKDFLNRIGVATTAYREVGSAGALAEARAALGGPAILKTARLGYDGKGQIRIADDTDPGPAWRALAAPRGVLEAQVDFTREISVVLGRGEDGAVAVFDAVENHHEDGILRTTRAPARIDPARAGQARAIAERIAGALDLVGVLAVEMFVRADGRLLVNEIAPRPHNSGHWTIDACPTSQFELLVRAICGLPLCGTERHSDAVMTNILGEEVGDWPAALADAGSRLHLYGKAAARPGRKMGHITRLRPRGRLSPRAAPDGMTPPARQGRHTGEAGVNMLKGGLIQMALKAGAGEPPERIRDIMNAAHLPLIAEAAAQGVQVLCLQEVFNQPYFCPSQDSRWYAAAEPVPAGPTVQLMREQARAHGMVIVAPIYEEESTGVYYNTAAVIDADGSYLGKYRKHHIPQVAGFYEKFFFKPGNSGYPVFETAFCRLGVYICYDRHFPEGWRALGLAGAEYVVNPSATVAGLSRHLWELEQPAAAVANGYYVGAVNRVGTEAPWDIGRFYGASYFADPRGRILAQASEDRDEVAVCEMDLGAVREARDLWQFYRDRRPETYEPLIRI